MLLTLVPHACVIRGARFPLFRALKPQSSRRSNPHILTNGDFKNQQQETKYMPMKFWWPTLMALQLVLMQNIRAKISNYESILPLTAEQIRDIHNLCDAFVAAFNATEQSRQTMQSMTAWRDEIFYGEPTGSTAPAAPAFAGAPAGTFTLGVVKQLFEFRDLIVASPGYTEAIGEDLGIVGTQQPSRPASEYTPQLKTVTSPGYQVNVSGSMQGMDALRVEYAPKGGNYSTVAFLTNTPGGFQITPATPGEPETGRIRAAYIRKNEIYGNYSAEYPVTLS